VGLARDRAGPVHRGIGGLGVDASGYVYALDSDRDRVQKFASDGGFVGECGGTGNSPGRFDIRWKGGLAVRGSSVHVADSDNHRIQRFDLDGRFELAWGSKGSGPGQFNHRLAWR
jgi:hypothetical protein